MVRRLLPLAVVATVLAGCAVLAHLRYGASLETSVVDRLTSQAAPWTNALGLGKTICDPYRLPGYLNTTVPFHDSRYVLFNDVSPQRGPFRKHRKSPSPQPGVDIVVPSYSAQILAGKAHELDWLRNKSVLLVGDSIDRNLVIHLGRRVFEGSKGHHEFLDVPDVPRPAESHQIGVAGLPALDFNVFNWFLMGVLVASPQDWFHPSEDPPQPFESRFPHFFLPSLPHLSPRTGVPDLVILNGGAFWDLDYLASQRSQQDSPMSRGAALTEAEMRQHRRRLRMLVRLLKSLTSQTGAPILYRSIQLGNATANNAFAHRRIDQLDRSNRLVMEEEGVHVLEWGKMTVGLDDQLSDPPVHYGIGSAQFIFGDMLLFHLKHLLGGSPEWEGCPDVRRRLRQAQSF